MLERYHFIGGEKSLSQTASPRRLDRFQGLTLIFFTISKSLKCTDASNDGYFGET